MAYTTIDNPELYFQTKLWTGTGSTNALTFDGSEDMTPDLVWIKLRAGAADYGHRIFDSVRGVHKTLNSSATSAEGTETNTLTVFGSDGFTVVDADEVNQSGGSHTYVAWCWKAGTSFTNDASATSVGSIDSAGSVSDTAGFSICTYTGISSAGTIKHGLSTGTPSMIIWKNRSASNGWITYHHKNTSAPETDYLELHATSATVDLNTIMNDTAPTSSVFSIGTEGAVGGGNTNNFVAYIFSERQGFSKFGSYTGNGNADGTFVYTGFRPAWVMIKRTDSTNSWLMYDNKRTPYNVVDKLLLANSSNAEATGSNRLDLVSNGFKARINDPGENADGGTHTYMAFAEAPLVNSNGVPCNAR
jgi:hypothetical protein